MLHHSYYTQVAFRCSFFGT